MPDYRITIKYRNEDTTIKEDLKELQKTFSILIEEFEIETIECWNGYNWIELQ